MSSYSSAYNKINSNYSKHKNLNNVIQDAITLEKNLIKSNTNLVNSLFNVKDNDGKSTGYKISTFSQKMEDMKEMTVDADTSTVRNENTKFSYFYHIIYIIMKVAAFVLVFYFTYKVLFLKSLTFLKNTNGVKSK
jgi:hypothetical protein